MRCSTSIRKRRCLLLVGVCLIAVDAGALSRADTVELPATKDTMIFQNHPDTHSAGGAPGFFAGTNSQPSIRRGLIAFDLSSVPAGAIVTDVRLRLVIGQLAGSAGGTGPPGYLNPTVGLHKLLVDWGEANAGASTAVVLNGIGQGYPVEDGDATWVSRVYHSSSPSLTWAAPGGQAGVDYTDAASSSLTLGNEFKLPSIWLSTPDLVEDVQGWLAAPDTNYGWMLKNTNESAVQTFRGFFSRNYNPSPTVPDFESYFPKLIVTYTIPEPSSFAMFALGLGMLAPRACRYAARRFTSVPWVKI
jgi:hypothetical protein